MLKKISKIAIACLFLSFILGSFNFVGIKTVNATVNFNPNVTIPGSDFKHEEPNKDKPDKKLGTQLSKSTKPIADYMKALYNWGIGVVGALAGVVLVIAGIIWLTAGGNNTQVEMAKKWIAGSLSGLVLALGSYFLLYQINPDLVKFKYYTIKGVDVGGEGNTSDEDRKWYYYFVWNGQEAYVGPFDSSAACEAKIEQSKEMNIPDSAFGGGCFQLLQTPPPTSP